MNHIIKLVFIVPELREIFRDKHALETLESLVNSLCHEIEKFSNPNEYDALLVSSRRALFSIEENALNSAAKEFINSCLATSRNDVGWHSSDVNPWLTLGREFISLADHKYVFILYPTFRNPHTYTYVVISLESTIRS